MAALHRRHHRFVAGAFPLLLFLLLLRTCRCSIQTRRITPGFQGSEMNWIDKNGLFLLSNSSAFVFGFRSPSTDNPNIFLLAVVHQPSARIVWAANSASPVSISDMFVFGADGDARLESGGATIWSTNTSGQGATAMVLLDSGNLVVLGENPASAPLWQSFDHPTDTLLPNQSFSTGMKLTSKPNNHNLSYQLDIDGGDMVLQADFRRPQPYWSIKGEKRIIKNEFSGDIASAVLVGGSWNFYDQNQSLLWQFIVSDPADANATWAPVLGSDGVISFYNLDSGDAEQTRIPQEACDTPEPCDPYYICYSGPRCQCPAVLSSDSNCNPDIISPCNGPPAGDSFDLKKVDDGVGYFATGFVKPAITRSSLPGCRDACLGNCSCLALFFDDVSGQCFLFDQIGSLRQLGGNAANFSMYIKIPSGGGNSADGAKGKGGGMSHVVVIVIIVLVTIALIVGLIYLAVRLHRRKRSPEPSYQGSSEEDNFLENISGMPVRFSYAELREATDDFSVKLGQGGFGSVYLGKLPDGSRVAVKKLEGIGQGKKEFRSEVSIIGSIHHIHLVRLRGFCADGTHRMLAYDYMGNGSLDRWIFRGHRDEGRHHLLDWETRFNIALGTAKGLAYLHEDCESKIVHCDIKPENVLLDDNFVAKVSDFGLAKLMTREQSHVFTTLRGTRGYLAPEWITNYAISEKSDVYSFGMVLLEIIGGRKNFDPSETSEKAHFPSFAFKMMEEGRVREVVDPRLQLTGAGKDGGRVETTVKVALWCVQEEMALRPSMTKVVQMLEGLADVPQPPASSQLGFRLYANIFKTISEEGASSATSGPSDCNSDAYLSAVRLSGPR